MFYLYLLSNKIELLRNRSCYPFSTSTGMSNEACIVCRNPQLHFNIHSKNFYLAEKQKIRLGRKCRESDFAENAEIRHCRKWKKDQILQKTQTDMTIFQRRGSDIAENTDRNDHCSTWRIRVTRTRSDNHEAT